MTEEELLTSFFEIEEKSGIYDVMIKGIPVYNFIRREIRKDHLAENGIIITEIRKKASYYKRLLSIIESCWHLLTLSSKNSKILFHTFRIENFGGEWMDRFIDPIIELGINDSDYVILETNNGRRQKPRLHRNSIIYDDFVVLLAKIESFFLYWYYVKVKYKMEFDTLNNSMFTLMPSYNQDKIKYYFKVILVSLLRMPFYKWLMKKKGIKSVVSASKSSFFPLFCTAKIMEVKVFELQHGLVYGASVTNGGRIERLFTPDKFLTFGDFEPRNVYGTDVSDVVTIGWALNKYIEKKGNESDIGTDDVLVLSQSSSTDYIIESTVMLAKDNPKNRFFLRCHPLEKLSADQNNRLSQCDNIFLQDTNVPFLIALKPFSFVLGVGQTTAVYEALSYGKRVGLFTSYNKTTVFLNEDVKKCFWQISDTKSFKLFLSSDESKKPSYKIYSDFNLESFIKIIN